MRGLRRAADQPWREHVTLVRGERVLVSAESSAGWVVATTHAAWLPDRSGLTRVGWESIDNAVWDRDASALQMWQNATLDQQPRRWVLPLDYQRDLLLVIKERIRATVVTSRQVRLTDTGGATIVARRPPGADRLTWSVSMDPGVSLQAPAVRDRVEAAVASLRAELGER